MDRTYNVFVDNGLFILANEIGKEIKDINLNDIKKSTKLFSEKFEKYLNCEYYKKNISMGFQNSAYTQGLKKDKKTKEIIETRSMKVKNQYDLILGNLGSDEQCSICGKKHIKLNLDSSYISSFTRCWMPHIHANTFINYINNLQVVNICPICLYLSVISIFNFEKAGDRIVLFNSDDDEFMLDYAYSKYNEVETNMAMDLKESKEKSYSIKCIIKTIEQLIDDGKSYKGYIEAVSFINSAQTEGYEENILTNKDIKFVEKLTNKNLRDEFKIKGFFSDLIKGKLQNNYIFSVLKNLKSIYVDDLSKELFNEIEEEYNRMRKDKLERLKDICKKIHDIDTLDEIKDLNKVDNQNSFEELLIKWNKLYYEHREDVLFNTDEFNNLADYKEFKSTKNRMIVEFMFLNKNN